MSELCTPVIERSRKFFGLALHDAQDDEIARTFGSWVAMLHRCFIPGAMGGDNYRGRGVTVCERWFEFANFAQDMGPRPHGTTLDRIDVLGDYGPTNCRWADAITQARNTRRTKRHLVSGKTYVQSELAAMVGVCDATILRRVRAGRPDSEILFAGKLPTGKLVESQVLEIRSLIAAGMTNIAIARQFGVSHTAISLIRRGITWRGI